MRCNSERIAHSAVNSSQDTDTRRGQWRRLQPPSGLSYLWIVSCSTRWCCVVTALSVTSIYLCFTALAMKNKKLLRASRENKINALLPKRNREGGCNSGRCLTLLHLLKHVCVFIFITTESVTSIHTLNSSNFIIFLCCKPAVW